MELSWLMKTRVTIAAAVGVILIGTLGWPLAQVCEPFTAVSIPPLTKTFALIGLAVIAGFIAALISHPYSREIGVLAVPAGLSVWALRGGSVANLIQANPALEQRQAIFASLRFESIFWLAVTAAGFVGVMLAAKIIDKTKSTPEKAPKTAKKPDSKPNKYINNTIALVVSVAIAQLCIGIFAQDIKLYDSKLGSVIAQPAVGQIAFAVFISFCIAGFVVKRFLGACYIWPIVASGCMTAFAVRFHAKTEILEHLTERWPAVFFSHPDVCILPIQMVAFGALGAVAGYWIATSFDYWRKHAD